MQMWFQIKELLAIIPKEKSFHTDIHLESSSPAFLNGINTKIGIVPLQTCYYFLI